MRKLRIATRRSPLALWQAEWVQTQLGQLGVPTELVLLASDGDLHVQPIDGSQPVGLFTKRIQRAVLEEVADLAVHSLKDLPTVNDPDLLLAAIPPREEVTDCLVTLAGVPLAELPIGASLGTGSRRRSAQLLYHRPDLSITPIRGNVQTRLQYVHSGALQGVILARAGLIRLGLDRWASERIPLEIMLPAPGQGALGIEVRSDDVASIEIVSKLNDPAAEACVLAERAFLRHLQAGCLAPVAALATLQPSQLVLEGAVLSLDGTERLAIRREIPWDGITADCDRTTTLGIQAAEEMLARGAGRLIADSREHPT